MGKLKEGRELVAAKEDRLRRARKYQADVEAILKEKRAAESAGAERAGRRQQDLEERFPAMAEGRR